MDRVVRWGPVSTPDQVAVHSTGGDPSQQWYNCPRLTPAQTLLVETYISREKPGMSDGHSRLLTAQILKYQSDQKWKIYGI